MVPAIGPQDEDRKQSAEGSAECKDYLFEG